MKTLKAAFRISSFLVMGLIIASCTKEVPREMVNNQKNNQVQQNPQPEQQKMPEDDIHKNIQQKTTSSIDTLKSGELSGDPKAEEISKAADEADAKYMQTKSDADKKECVSKQLAAANYLMFDANLSPKKKYRPALQRYRRVLELDPNNKEAAANKKQIEDIYQSMGMPVPN
jgi:hypothetical protein